MEVLCNQDAPISKVCIYGLGDFGLAFLAHCDRVFPSDTAISAFARSDEVTQSLQSESFHPSKFPGHLMPSRAEYHTEPEEAVQDSDLIILTTPSRATREVLATIKDAIKPGATLLNTAKALDIDTGNRLSVVCGEALAGTDYQYGLLAGGTIASDLLRGEPLAADVASNNRETADRLANALSSPLLTVYATDDLFGVEMAAAMKNLVSMAVGIAAGREHGIGTETRVLSKVADSIGDACIRMGADPKTFSFGSQCWGNDMLMSAIGNTRNREFGFLLGQGHSIEAALGLMYKAGKTVESVATISSLSHQPELLEVPVLRALHAFISNRETTIEEVSIELLGY